MKSRKTYYSIMIMLLISFLGINDLFAYRPHRVGTTTANFLEIGYGIEGIGMGDAYVSMVSDVSAVYWNPAGLAFLQGPEVQLSYNPWLVDVNSSFFAAGVPIRNVGTLAFSLIYMNYGDIEVTTVNMQNGTGDFYRANEYAGAISYGRAIANWFSFGASVKYVSSQIWHMSGSAMAIDLGVLIHTSFFSPTNKREDGMRIGMSISNYGTRLKYDGIDLINPIDILPNENGNYRDVPGQFRLSEWELPQIFRVGVSVNIIKSSNQILTVSMDALHPNNNSESVNIGTQYRVIIPSFGEFYLRGGYKGLFMYKTEYGLTFGAGFSKRLIGNTSFRVDYAYRSIGIFGIVHSYGIGFTF